MHLLDDVRSAWGWAGIEPVNVIDDNDFGNLLIEDIRGQYWRLCPEELYCKVVAGNSEELNCLVKDPEFLSDWHMRALVDEAFQQLGALAPGCKYCLKIPGVLGGKYDKANLGTISFDELIRASGDIAQQIAGLPDGTFFELSVTD